jgi:hypothetical protein
MHGLAGTGTLACTHGRDVCTYTIVLPVKATRDMQSEDSIAHELITYAVRPAVGTVVADAGGGGGDSGSFEGLILDLPGRQTHSTVRY